VPLSVLHLADNPGDVELLRARLADDPRVQIEHVASRAEALRRLHVRPWDVVLLDLDLPDGRGLHTLEGLVTAYPQLAIVVVTGFGGNDPDLALEALCVGAQDVIAASEITRTDWWRVLTFACEPTRFERRAAHYAHVDALNGLQLPSAAPALRTADAARRTRGPLRGTHRAGACRPSPAAR
jgi:CheY-like chemotaxis protein